MKRGRMKPTEEKLLQWARDITDAQYSGTLEDADRARRSLLDFADALLDEKPRVPNLAVAQALLLNPKHALSELHENE